MDSDEDVFIPRVTEMRECVSEVKGEIYGSKEVRAKLALLEETERKIERTIQMS